MAASCFDRYSCQALEIQFLTEAKGISFQHTYTPKVMAGQRSREDGWKSSGLFKGPGIPAPSGIHRVGCADLMHQLEGDDKGLLIRLHYPTEAMPNSGYQYSLWYPHPRTPSMEEPPLLDIPSEAPPTFPVIVFSHGLSAMRCTYSAIVSDLASHGYIVACVEHRDKSASLSFQRVPKQGGQEGELQDEWILHEHHGTTSKEFPIRNSQVKQRADEVRKSLDILQLLNEGAEIKNMLVNKFDFKQFKGRMDISKAAVMGHSFGGGTVVQALSEDDRFKCGVALDCWMLPIHRDILSSGISQPLYFINSYDYQWKENVNQMMSLTKEPDETGITPCKVQTLIGTNHFNQTDTFFVIPRTFLRLGSVESRLNSEIAHQVNMDICHQFLKRYLLKDPTCEQLIPNLDGTKGHSEHILFGTNLDLTPKAEGGQDKEEEDNEEDNGEDVAVKKEGVVEVKNEEGEVEAKNEEGVVEVKSEEGEVEVKNEEGEVKKAEAKNEEGEVEVKNEEGEVKKAEAKNEEGEEEKAEAKNEEGEVEGNKEEKEVEEKEVKEEEVKEEENTNEEIREQNK